MSKVMSAQEAISLIKDGDKIGVGGFMGWVTLKNLVLPLKRVS